MVFRLKTYCWCEIQANDDCVKTSICRFASAIFGRYTLLLIYYYLGVCLVYIVLYVYVCMDRHNAVCCVCFMCHFVCNSLCYTPCTLSLQLCMHHINLFIKERLLYCRLTTHILVLFIYYITKVFCTTKPAYNKQN